MMVVGVVSAESFTANCLTVASNALDPVRMIGFGRVVALSHITVCALATWALSSAPASVATPAATRVRRVMNTSN